MSIDILWYYYVVLSFFQGYILLCSTFMLNNLSLGFSVSQTGSRVYGKGGEEIKMMIMKRKTYYHFSSNKCLHVDWLEG